MNNREDSLKTAIKNYKSTPNGDFWKVKSSRFMLIRKEIIIALTENISFKKILDFACGLGVILAEYADKIEYGLGIDGAPPAIEKAQNIYKRYKNMEFRVGQIKELKSCLEVDHYDLLIITDALSYFDRSQQREIFCYARANGVDYLLLEVRAVDPACPGMCSYTENYDFKKVSEIIDFLSSCGYEVIKMNPSRFYERKNIMKMTAYKMSVRLAAYLLRRLIDVITAILLIPKRWKGDDIYDPLALKYRLRMASWLNYQPGMRKIAEPMMSHVALLCRRR